VSATAVGVVDKETQVSKPIRSPEVVDSRGSRKYQKSVQISRTGSRYPSYVSLYIRDITLSVTRDTDTRVLLRIGSQRYEENTLNW
jgi:hypothetical protein